MLRPPMVHLYTYVKQVCPGPAYIPGTRRRHQDWRVYLYTCYYRAELVTQLSQDIF